jgi:hypothetical protein
MGSEAHDRLPDDSPFYQYKSWLTTNFVNRGTKKPQHHSLWSPRSESKSFFFLKQAHGIKRAIKEAGEGGGAVAPARGAREGAAAPAH